jgi:CheY-like chemotaxis protein
VAKALGMRSVAEGVETFEQLIELQTLGCDFAQGYFLGRPEAPELASALLGQVIPTGKLELVLVCDDNPINRLVDRIAFEAAGATVAEAVDGIHCIERARALHPDLIVLDLHMPNLDGMSALPMLRAACPQATIIIVSATRDGLVIDSGLHAGAVAYFDKVGFAARIPALIAQYRRIPYLAAGR